MLVASPSQLCHPPSLPPNTLGGVAHMDSQLDVELDCVRLEVMAPNYGSLLLFFYQREKADIDSVLDRRAVGSRPGAGDSRVLAQEEWLDGGQESIGAKESSLPPIPPPLFKYHVLHILEPAPVLKNLSGTCLRTFGVMAKNPELQGNLVLYGRGGCPILEHLKNALWDGSCPSGERWRWGVIFSVVAHAPLPSPPLGGLKYRSFLADSYSPVPWTGARAWLAVHVGRPAPDLSGPALPSMSGSPNPAPSPFVVLYPFLLYSVARTTAGNFFLCIPLPCVFACADCIWAVF